MTYTEDFIAVEEGQALDAADHPDCIWCYIHASSQWCPTSFF